MDEEEVKRRYAEFEVDPNFAIREEEDDDSDDEDSYQDDEEQDDSDAEPSPNKKEGVNHVDNGNEINSQQIVVNQ